MIYDHRENEEYPHRFLATKGIRDITNMLVATIPETEMGHWLAQLGREVLVHRFRLEEYPAGRGDDMIAFKTKELALVFKLRFL